MMIGPTPHHDPSPFDQDFDCPPPAGWFPTWIAGILLPLGMLLWGFRSIYTAHVSWPDHGSPVLFDGPKARTLGIAAISLATLLHCHYFWGNVFESGGVAMLGKIISLLALIGSLGYFVVRVGIWG